MRALSLAAVLVLTVAALPLAARGASGVERPALPPASRLSANDDMFQPHALPSFPVPPGVGIFGPEGPRNRVDEPAAPNLGEPHSVPSETDAAPAPAKPAPLTRTQLLDQLFARLAHSTDSDEAKGIAGAIQRVWMHSGSDTADLLMQRATAALGGEDYSLADRLLGAIVVIDPTWTEGWDERATERFLVNDYSGAMADLSHVLALEPRHFGALAAMGFILQKVGFDKEALRVFRKTLEIYPQQDSLRKIVDDLAVKVEGRDI